MIGDGLGNTNDMDSHNKDYSDDDTLQQVYDNGSKLMNDIYCSHIYDDYNCDDFDGSHVRNRQI